MKSIKTNKISENDQIIIYQTSDGKTQIDVRMENETVWLNAEQMALLFERDSKTIRKHIDNAIREELAGDVVVANFAHTTQHGAIEGKTQVQALAAELFLVVQLLPSDRVDIVFRSQPAAEIVDTFLFAQQAVAGQVGGSEQGRGNAEVVAHLSNRKIEKVRQIGLGIH